MGNRKLYSIIESPVHPDFSALYRRMNLEETRLNSMRKAISELKNARPDFIVAEFIYGYSNNYAGVNISNLDVLLFSLQKYAPQTRVIVLVDKSEYQFVHKLNEIFPLHSVLQFPVPESHLEAVLQEYKV